MFKSTLEKMKHFLMDRRRAYLLTFSYQNPSNKIVLEDLSKFCRAHGSCYHKDPKKAAMLEGRREVWLRIQNNLQLTDDQIFELHNLNVDRGE